MDSMPFSLSDLAALSGEIAVAVGACWVLVQGAFDSQRRHPRRFAWVTLAFLVIALAAVATCLPAQVAQGHTTAFAGQLGVDDYGIFFSAVFLLTAILAIGASLRFLDDREANRPEYYFFMLTALLGMMLMARAIDLISIFVGLELQALSVYVLVGFLKSDRRSNEASLKYFILGGMSSAIFVYAVSLLYAVTGATALDALSAAIPAGDASPILLLGLILLVVSLGFKVAAVPFHLWAPDAYTGAPTPVALFISVASKAAAFAMMMRILYVGLAPLADAWTTLIALLAVTTMTFGNVAALSQTNIKRLLAHSSIAQAGYALIGVAAGTAYGVSATMFYLLAYTFMNVGAWAVVIYLRRNGVASDQLDDLAGLSRRSPWVAAAMLVCLMSLGGIPPFLGFVGKWFVFGAAIDGGIAWLAVIGALNAAISMYYYMRIVVMMYLRRPEDEVGIVSSRPLDVTLAITAAVTSIGIVWGAWLFDWARSASLPF
jgi:NADH-quinone oxidoreductase subunit N